MPPIVSESMSLIGEVSVSNAVNLATNIPNTTNRFIKIVANGELAAQGQDRRLLLRLNHAARSYKSYVDMGGDGRGGEWGDASGLYLGRNGWGRDATFSLEYTLAVNASAQKVVGSGNAVFADGSDAILGYASHGFFTTSDPITSVELLFTGGVATWNCKIYVL